MTPSNYKPTELKVADAIGDTRLSNVEFRILTFVEYAAQWSIDWGQLTWREIGEHYLGGMYRQTIAKAFKRLQECGYLMLNE